MKEYLKYIFWLGLFPPLVAWFLHLMTILVILSVGEPVTYYEAGIAGFLWICYYGITLGITVAGIINLEKKS